mmetsp:Transcript_16110/g.17903  ORF Transcript_16110/g.17903 Transcript_16110/m.17903 type:complete len:82 (-) Transcript_16110:602-847(-)
MFNVHAHLPWLYANTNAFTTPNKQAKYYLSVYVPHSLESVRRHSIQELDTIESEKRLDTKQVYKQAVLELFLIPLHPSLLI